MESPRPVPPKSASHRGVGLREGLEEMVLGGGRDTDSRVSHSEFQMGVIVVRQGAKTHFNFATLGELNGIAGQIEQDLLHAHPVARHRIRRFIGHAAVECQPLLACPHGKHPRNLVQHPPQAEGRQFQFQLARFDFGRVQQVVQERQEQVRRPLRGLQAILDGRVGRLR